MNEFIESHKKVCAKALIENMGNKIAYFNVIELIMKKLEPDTW